MRFLLFLVLSLSSHAAAVPVSTNGDDGSNVQVLDVAPAWAALPVGFALLTQSGHQFVAFYDSSRQLTLAERNLSDTSWKFKKLPSFIGWDSHNYIAMALDRNNCLHVSGNMHVNPLTYFKGTVPFDIDSVEPVAHMTGQQEDKVTYPKFIKGPNGELIFNYREGMSGDGNSILNIYDEKSKSWSRLMDLPLFDGENTRNAYPVGPEMGPDHYYHMTWVWRETPDAETNHSLCYARSKDLVHWETIQGKPVALPITLETEDVVVDPIPPVGGIINGSGRIGFDQKKGVIISYPKFDEKGNTQLYLARFEDGEWKHFQATNWAYRWKFWGGASIAPEVSIAAVRVYGQKLGIFLRHIKYGAGTFEVDPSTWRLKGSLLSSETPLPQSLTKVQSDFPGMSIQWADDSGELSGDTSYRLRWETLGINRDLPRNPPLPDPVMLKLVSIKKQ